MFAGLAKSYVSALNNGGVPVIRSAWDNVLEAECHRALKLALERYESDWAKRVGENAGTPVDDAQLRSTYMDVKKSAMDYFKMSIRPGAIGDSYTEKLKTKIRDLFGLAIQKNLELSEAQCEKVMASLCDAVDSKISDGNIKDGDSLQESWDDSLGKVRFCM